MYLFPKLGQFGLTHFLKSNQMSDVVMMSISGTMKGDFACDPDESSERSGGRTLAWRSVQPDPEAKPGPGTLRLDSRQELVDHTRCLVGMHRCQGPTSLPAAPPSLPEGSLLEEDAVASILVAESVSLGQLSSGCWLLPLRLLQPLAAAFRSQTDHQQPQDTQETHAAAAAAAADGLFHPPPRHEVKTRPTFK